MDALVLCLAFRLGFRTPAGDAHALVPGLGAGLACDRCSTASGRAIGGHRGDLTLVSGWFFTLGPEKPQVTAEVAFLPPPEDAKTPPRGRAETTPRRGAETTRPEGAKSKPQNETKVIGSKVIETKIGVGALRRVAPLNAVGHLQVVARASP
ncbi:hypothetical protein ACFW2D_18005 [Streptomyces sp. NPDC058914]|uniref:hypothetical protein n=1 Tax=Streptomyces sp. NPDC058914 TaxID=3346671 RepID=UPI0036B75BCF